MTTICAVTIEGTRPLLMHNGRLADPLDAAHKALKAAAKKKTKSDDELVDLGRLEYMGSLYYDTKMGPYLPVDNLQAMLVEGARKRKLGKEFESLIEVVVPDGADGYRLDYKGPRDPDGLWARDEFRLRKQARVMQSRVMRTRPRFPAGWACKFAIEILDDGPDAEHVERALADAGRLIGIGDWSPRYGCFTVTEFKT